MCHLLILLAGIVCYGIYFYFYQSPLTEVHMIIEEFPISAEEEINQSSILLHPIQKEVIDPESDSCPICYEHDVECKLECQHSFCKRCLVKALETKKDSCPYCRQPVSYTLQKVISVTEIEKQQQPINHVNTNNGQNKDK